MPTARRAANASTSARRILVCLALLSCLALSPIALADGEPAAWVGRTLRPVDSDSIRMVRERVVIDLSPNRARVTATFIFRNEGPECEQIIAFPAGERGLVTTRDFRAWVDGAQVEVGTQSPSFEHLYYWTASFPANGEREVRVAYQTRRDTSIGGSLADTHFTYILTTGRRWKGPIGSAEIVLNLRDIQHHQILDLQPAGHTRTPSGYRWLRRDVEPEQDVRVRFHTSPLAVIVRLADGRDWLYSGYPPIVRDDTVLISARFLEQTAASTAEWDNITKAFTARRGPLAVRCQLGSREAYLGDRKITLSVPPEVHDGEFMVPLDLAEPLGLNALYKAHTKQLFLRQNHLNYDAGIEPEYVGLHLAPRRYLLSEYEAEETALERDVRNSSGAARADALLKLADLAYYRGDWAGAEAKYASVPQLQPRHLWANWWQARAMQRQGRFGDALRLFADQAFDGSSAAAAPERYVTLSAYEAVLCVTRHRRNKRVPDDEVALAAAAACLAEEVASGRDLRQLRVEMIPLLGRAEAYDQMLAVADRLLAAGDLSDGEFHTSLRRISADRRWRRDEGMRLGYMMADRLRGTDLEEVFVHALAEAEYDQRNYPQAVELNRRLVRDFPKSDNAPRYLSRIGEATKKLGDVEAYKDTCWSLITAHPESADGLAMHFAADATGEQLRWMIENVPHPSAYALMTVASDEYLLGNYEEASKLYGGAGVGGDVRTGLSIAPTLMWGLCRFHLGDIESARGAFEYLERERIGSYQEVLAAGPDSEAAYLALAQYCYGYPHWDWGRAIVGRGIEEHPESARLRHALGQLFWRERQPIAARPEAAPLLLGAIEQWEAALALDPGFDAARRDVSIAYWELGQSTQDPGERRRCYAEVVKHWDLVRDPGPESHDFVDYARNSLREAAAR